jgi:hypothetical protein
MRMPIPRQADLDCEAAPAVLGFSRAAACRVLSDADE